MIARRLLPPVALALLLGWHGLLASPAYAQPAGPGTAAPVVAPPLPAAATPAATPAPAGNAGAEVVTVTRWLPDPREWAADVFSQTLVSMLSTVAQSLRGLLGSGPGGPLDLLTQTPPAASYANPAVVQLWGLIRAVANAALALVVLWGGYGVMAGRHTGAPYHEAVALLPRLLVGTLLVNTSLWWGQLGIDLGNALCAAVGGAGLPDWSAAASSPTQALLDVLLVLIYLVLGLLLLIQMLMRLALLDVLLVLAPLAMLCWILPATEGWARRWSFFFVGAALLQFVQVLALHLGGGVLTTLAPAQQGGAGVPLFLAMAVLLLTLRLPGMFIHHAADGMAALRSGLLARQTVRAALPRGAGAASGASAGRAASGWTAAGGMGAAGTTPRGSGGNAGATNPSGPPAATPRAPRSAGGTP